MPLPDNLLTPISADNPCGEPASSAPWYDKLRAFRKPNEAALEAFLAPQAANDRRPRIMTRDIWAPREPKKLFDGLCDALATKGKDLELATWVAEALAWTEGFAGLNQGLRFITALLETYWDELHPLPDEGDHYMRTRHLEWLGMSRSIKDSCLTLVIGFIPVTASGFTLTQYEESRAVPGKEDSSESAREARKEAQAVGKPLPEDFDKAFTATPKPFYKALNAEASACREALGELETVCEARFERDSRPGFTALKEVLEKAENTTEILLKRKLEEDPDPPPPPPPAEPMEMPEGLGGEDAGAGGAEEGTGDGLTTTAEPRNKAEAFARAAALARYLRRAEPANPVPYLLVRSLRWGELYGAGPEISEVLLVAPPTSIRAQLKSLASATQWAQVLELAESAMAAEYGRGWLDLQRYSVKACEALGYDHAARAILCAVRHLLTDYPRLPQSTLSDDTGAANPETLQWLAEIG